MRALRDMNLPKFVFEDVPLFLGLISDLFPGLECPRVRYSSFTDAVEHILQENKCVILPNQVSHLLSHVQSTFSLCDSSFLHIPCNLKTLEFDWQIFS